MERIWLNQSDYPVVADINPDKYTSLVDIFETSVKDYSTNTAYINMRHKITFDDLDMLSRQLAGYLQGLGLTKGATIAVMLPNLLQYPVSIFGILRAGYTVVNINPLYTARELKHQLNDAKVSTIIIVDTFAPVLQKVLSETSVKNIVTTRIGDLLPGPKRLVTNFVIKHIKKMVTEFDLPESITFDKALKIGENFQYKRPEISGDDIAFLQYTGGTTGSSKGAMLSHRNMVANLEQVAGIIEGSVMPGKDLVVTALPLYHIFALTTNCLTFLKYGCPNLLITNPRDLPGFVRELKKYPFAVLTGVNTLFNGLINTPGFSELNFKHLKFALGGGMAVQRSVAERWRQLTGKVLVEGYGLTECSPVVAVNPIIDMKHNGAVGMPVPSTQIKLINDSDKEAAIGEPGELHVKGPQVMVGYLGQELATKAILKDGWLATGDIAKMDEKGFLYIVDRKKDMILVSGFNVYPNEIEEVAAMHDDILEAAAIGIEHEVSGEIVKLYVVKRDPALTEEVVIAHCKSLLTGYKVPKVIEFRDELPKTNVGKILRRELRTSEAC